MQKESNLKFNLAVILTIILIGNAALITYAGLSASHGRVFSLVPEGMPVGIKWLILAGLTLFSVGGAFWTHRLFIEGGVSPVDTTWLDLVIMTYILLTGIVALFMAETSWLFFAFLVVLLFFFSAFVLRRLLNDARRWLVWLVGSVVLSVLTAIFVSTLTGS